MKTIRVRIAVAVNSAGQWTSAGWPKKDADREIADCALELLDVNGGEAVHFIEADVPLPESQTIEGKVMP